MKMLLHLIAKDIRFRRVTLGSFWLCLLVAVLWQVFARGKHLDLLIASAPLGLCYLFGALLALTLFLEWIHLDHPHATDGFLQTRPLSPTMRWLPKLLLWGLLVMALALLAILAQMAILQIDLRGEDYRRAALKTGLIFCGCFGALAVIIGCVRRGSLAMLLCIPVLTMLLIFEGAYGSRMYSSLTSPDYVRQLELLQSRHFVAWNLAGLAGFVFLAWRLARGTWRSLVVGLLVVAMLCFGTWIFWRINLIQRAPAPVIAEPARLQELAANTRIKMAGYLYESQRPEPGGTRFRSGPISIEPPEDVLEWPSLTGSVQMHKVVNVADGQKAEGYWLATPPSGTESQGQLPPGFDQPPAPNHILLRLLGLSKELAQSRAGSQGLHEPFVRNLATTFQWVTQTSLPPDARLSIAGQLQCEWYRPAIVAAVPLVQGATFTRDGNSVTILGAQMVDGKLKLTLHLIRHQGYPGISSAVFDQAPDFQLCVANTARGEFALRRSAGAVQGSLAMGATQLKVDAQYIIINAGEVPVKPDSTWLEKGQLYIIQRRSIGITEHSCQAELIVKTRS
jgi:hypothetical protein